MTEHQNELFRKLFSKYGSYRIETCDKRINIWESHPDKLKNEKEIENCMKHSADTIRDLENAIDMMKAYQAALIDRYNFFMTSPKQKKIRLERYKKYRGNVFFYIIHYEINLINGEQIEVKRITYTGKERKKAFQDFEKAKKENPAAIIEVDTENHRWEK